MFISIGYKCDVKYNIDKFIGEKPTFFFDWLMTDMRSVNTILGSNNIDNILNFENIIQNPKNPRHGNNSVMNIKSLSFCQSLHDVPFKYIKSDLSSRSYTAGRDMAVPTTCVNKPT